MRLDPQTAADRMNAAQWEPQVPYPGSIEKPWKSKCTICSEIGQPRLHNVSPEARACDTCAQRGIDLSLPGFIYIVTHDGLSALKVGIGTSTTRLTQHDSLGWRTHRSWKVNRTEVAWVHEQQIIAWLRDAGIPPAVGRGDMKYRGYTETASTTLVSLSRVTAAIDALMEKHCLNLYRCMDHLCRTIQNRGDLDQHQ